MTCKKLVHIDLIGALQDRVGIVHNHQPFRSSAAGELVGVVTDTGRIANEQSVKFGNSLNFRAPQKFGTHAKRPRGTAESFQSLFVRRRIWLVVVVKNRERRILPDVAYPHATTRHKLRGGLRNEESAVRCNVGGTQKLDVGQAPFAVVAGKACADQWRPQHAKKLLAQRIVQP